MSDWNELSSISEKWKFCQIYWQWILIEPTFLYTVVYRTFLYNPTNLKVPKKAPCRLKCFNGLFLLVTTKGWLLCLLTICLKLEIWKIEVDWFSVVSTWHADNLSSYFIITSRHRLPRPFKLTGWFTKKIILRRLLSNQFLIHRGKC